MKREKAGDTVIVSGEVTLKDARSFPTWEGRFSYYHTVDLSGATFTEEEERQYRILGYGHSGPVTSNKPVTKKFSSLIELVKDIHTGTLILPPDVTRKQLNACIKNPDIERIVVPDGCALFSMKDGSIWNKKGTTLVHEQPEAAVMATCKGCGKAFPARLGTPHADGGLVCPDCMMHYGLTGIYGEYLPYGAVCYLKDDPRLAGLVAKDGMTLEEFTEKTL